MKFSEFLTRRRLRLPPNVLAACQDGLYRMSRSREGAHDLRHVENMIGLLDKFLDSEGAVPASRIDMPVMLLSIIWHDVWKAGKRSSNRRQLFYHWLAEGLAAMRTFSRLTRRYNLDRHVTRQVRYAIRKHITFQILPTRRNCHEARILVDMDRLDLWNYSRLNRMMSKFLTSGHISAANTRFFMLFFSRVMIPESYRLNYAWSRQQMYYRRKRFVSVVSDLIFHRIGRREADRFLAAGTKVPVSPFTRLRTALSRLLSS